jgi:hypothetical protein
MPTTHAAPRLIAGKQQGREKHSRNLSTKFTLNEKSIILAAASNTAKSPSVHTVIPAPGRVGAAEFHHRALSEPVGARVHSCPEFTRVIRN